MIVELLKFADVGSRVLNSHLRVIEEFRVDHFLHDIIPFCLCSSRALVFHF